MLSEVDLTDRLLQRRHVYDGDFRNLLWIGAMHRATAIWCKPRGVVCYRVADIKTSNALMDEFRYRMPANIICETHLDSIGNIT